MARPTKAIDKNNPKPVRAVFETTSKVAAKMDKLRQKLSMTSRADVLRLAINILYLIAVELDLGEEYIIFVGKDRESAKEIRILT